ncbi:MAG: hypothetical protein QOH06_1808 [Acidobacteriota bacterium]|jgi:hypothetical protein|nr:hypothetical protein [Acidobacteriota bacterium]
MKRTIGTAIFAAALCAALTSAPARGQEPPFTTDFRIEDCELEADGRNAYFSLVPGDQLVLTGEDDGEEVVVQITVLKQKRTITFTTDKGKVLRVKTRVVEEREWVDDELVEVSRNYFARCDQTGDIFYFGEAVDIYEDDEIVSHDGAWLAGVAGAQPGVIMPGSYMLGARYFQERAPGAMDRGEHTAMGLTVTTPAGTFHNCVEVIETSRLEPGHESLKRYCPGIGLVQDNDAVLEEFDLHGKGDDD